MDFLRRHNAVRATKSGGIPRKTKAEWLADYERMLRTGCNLQGERLTDAQYKHVELQAAEWRRELKETE